MPSALTLRHLARSIDAELAPAPPATELLTPHDGAIARLGLALDASPAVLAWAAGEGAVDALFVHRRWTRDAPAWPPALGGLANHDGFDRRFGLATAPEVAAALGLHDVQVLDVRDDHPLAIVGDVAPTNVAGVRASIAALFGDVEDAWPAAGDDGPVRRVVLARAMTAALVEGAAAAGADVYVTGQLRAPARAAAATSGLSALAVGHRRSERWALGRLAERLGAAWPALRVTIAPEAPGGR